MLEQELLVGRVEVCEAGDAHAATHVVARARGAVGAALPGQRVIQRGMERKEQESIEKEPRPCCIKSKGAGSGSAVGKSAWSFIQHTVQVSMDKEVESRRLNFDTVSFASLLCAHEDWNADCILHTTTSRHHPSGSLGVTTDITAGKTSS